MFRVFQSIPSLCHVATPKGPVVASRPSSMAMVTDTIETNPGQLRVGELERAITLVPWTRCGRFLDGRVG